MNLLSMKAVTKSVLNHLYAKLTFSSGVVMDAFRATNFIGDESILSIQHKKLSEAYTNARLLQS
jgi:hypothetical protein